MAKEYLPIGNPTKNCENPLLTTSVTLNVPATGEESTTFTVPNNRGPIRAVEIYVDNNTIADLALASANLSGDKFELIVDSPMIKHSGLYANAHKPIICNIAEQVVVSLKAVNGSATPMKVTYVFLYYDPYVTSLKPIND